MDITIAIVFFILGVLFTVNMLPDNNSIMDKERWIMYKMINEDLRIASCKMSELPKYITDILQQNEKISVLYDHVEDVLL